MIACRLQSTLMRDRLVRIGFFFKQYFNQNKASFSDAFFKDDASFACLVEFLSAIQNKSASLHISRFPRILRWCFPA